MNESRLTQVARFGGLAFVVLAVGGFLAAGDAGLDNGAKIATYFADHRDRLLASYQIVAIGLLAFAVWAWSLMTTLERRDASSRNLAIAVFVSGAIVVAVEFGVVALFMTLALISDQPVDPQIARALANAAQVFSDMEYFPQALFFLALGLAILRTRLGGAWLGWSALALVPISLVCAAPALGLDIPGAILSFGWIIVASIVMIRSDAAGRDGHTAGATLLPDR